MSHFGGRAQVRAKESSVEAKARRRRSDGPRPTAGFWGTHACTEKKGSQNITGKVIDATDRTLGNGGELIICGEHLVNTAVNDAACAVEALCVTVKGDQ